MTTINIEFWLDFLLAVGGGFALSVALWFQLVDDRDIHPSYIGILLFLGSIILLAAVPEYTPLGKGPLFAVEVLLITALVVFDVVMAWWLHTSPDAVRSPVNFDK